MYTCILLYKMDCPLPQIPNTHPSGVFGTFPQLYTNLKTTCSGSQSQLLTNASSLIGQLDIKSTWFFFSLSYSSSKSYSPLLDLLSSYLLPSYSPSSSLLLCVSLVVLARISYPGSKRSSAVL